MGLDWKKLLRRHVLEPETVVVEKPPPSLQRSRNQSALFNYRLQLDGIHLIRDFIVDSEKVKMAGD